MQRINSVEDSRSLSKSSSKLLVRLAEQDRHIFNFAEAHAILGISGAATRKLLGELLKKKWLVQLTRGKYLVVPMSAGEGAEFSENWYVVAKYLTEPKHYFLSHYSGMEIHNMTTQPLSTVFISTPHKKREIKALGATFRFVYIDAAKMWGSTDVWATPTEKVRVSDLERTVIDCLNNPRLCGGISEIAKGIYVRQSDLDYSKLLTDVRRFGSKAVAKRLGFLLDLYGLGTKISSELTSMAGSSYTLLDPSLPASGKHKSNWHLRLNLDPEELKQIVAT
jgi:predicted transcriptional regulator of viral defense system